VERLLIAAMEVRFTLNKIEGEANGFPFGVELPLGIFLDVLINPKAPSPFALIEALFRSLSRHHNEGREGVGAAFEGLLKGRMKEFEDQQAADEGKAAAGSASGGKKKEAKTRSDGAPPAKVTAPLSVRASAFLDCIGGALNVIWSEGVTAKGVGTERTL
jgi:hypothetical protein